MRKTYSYLKIVKCIWFYIIGINLISASIHKTEIDNFPIEELHIRNVVTGIIKGNEVLYFSSLSEGVGCYSLNGKKVWSAKIDIPAVIFEIQAVDIDGDNNDDLLAASGNGSIYCWSSKGNLLWKYTPNHKVRFSEIAVVNNNNHIQIFAGGNDYNLYELDAYGKLRSTTKIDGVVRKIETGNFVNKNKKDLFLMTYTHDKFRWEFMGIIDATSKKTIKTLSHKIPAIKDLSKAMVTNISISDINKDGLSDILFFGDISFFPLFIALDANFNVIAKYKVTNRKEKQRYANTKGTSLLPARDEIMFQFGSIMYTLDLSGKLIEKAGDRYEKTVYSSFTLAPKSKQLIAGGEVDGGNGIYFFDLKKENWIQKTQKLQGTSAQVEKNINTLYKQILDFKMPSYQKPSDKKWVMVSSKDPGSKIMKLKGNDILFSTLKSPKESTERSHLVSAIGKVALKKDKRGKYKDSREDIIDMAKTYEAKGQSFTFWAGHGNDPFYIQIETLEQILKVAPKTCQGFIYAEMDNVNDPRIQHFVREYIPRLAKAIRVHNKAKLYFRFKNTFWALTNKLPLWQEMFFSNKYNDILVPASEDTSSRTQDINLAGRVGMRTLGYVDDFAMRLVDDNPTSWRPLSPGGQRSISPYLRQGVIMAAYGAKHGVIANNKFTKEPGLDVLFALMKSGALPIVESEDILSIGSWHLIKDVNKDLIHSIDHHHSLKQYNVNDEDAIFSVAQMHWAGTNLPENDYSKIALGVNYRWLNYMPIMPHGMVPIAPIEAQEKLKKQKAYYSISNGKKGFLNDQFVSAKKYTKEFKKILKQGEKALPILVKGASWSAIRLDKTHIRLILVDPGYIEPKDREVSVLFHGKIPTKAIDILSKEELKCDLNSIKTTVLAGSLKFIDLTY